jgi:hypothetical protein
LACFQGLLLALAFVMIGAASQRISSHRLNDQMVEIIIANSDVGLANCMA